MLLLKEEVREEAEVEEKAEEEDSSNNNTEMTTGKRIKEEDSHSEVVSNLEVEIEKKEEADLTGVPTSESQE